MGSMFDKPKKIKPPPKPKPINQQVVNRTVTQNDKSIMGDEASEESRSRRLLSSQDNADTGAGLGGNTASGTGGKRKLLG